VRQEIEKEKRNMQTQPIHDTLDDDYNTFLESMKWMKENEDKRAREAIRHPAPPRATSPGVDCPAELVVIQGIRIEQLCLKISQSNSPISRNANSEIDAHAFVSSLLLRDNGNGKGQCRDSCVGCRSNDSANDEHPSNKR
jgi:hypothetical protein